jgi:hypothetical protein
MFFAQKASGSRGLKLTGKPHTFIHLFLSNSLLGKLKKPLLPAELQPTKQHLLLFLTIFLKWRNLFLFSFFAAHGAE